ncbi:hypothetical protein CCHL11_02899 [Colletotrichum chlorophyti]|uniref:Uncharacterized protein n=1 Tax=Colletotrichum chlorophyti TaxID=708187 RepID=A0A1Q8S0Z9_9PEZI|nr:hypothetical protein CCHL11_02899 [Colletotrichum chlorophyti]
MALGSCNKPVRQSMMTSRVFTEMDAFEIPSPGKTDAKNGNFGVMHIDLTTTNETLERDAAAKRTSEGTLMAAKMAQTDRYVPFKRSKYVHRPDDQSMPNPSTPAAPLQRTSPLTAAETKAEQARLLKLLRSLHPPLVVDQLCKALSFFGGVPGEQPLTDTSFPDSAEANGSGALFVGWLAEIFPNLGQGSIPNVQEAPTKRPRGRPKGSKNTKGKKDKDLRKRLLVARSADIVEGRRAACTNDDVLADDSWIDIEDGVTDKDADDQQADKSRGMVTPLMSKSHPVAGQSASGVAVETRVAQPNGEAHTAATTATPTPRRRGRPKGSKNRPKNVAPIDNDPQIEASIATSHATPVSIPAAAANHGAGPGETDTRSIKKRKAGPGRPKGSKNRPKESVAAHAANPQPMLSPLASASTSDLQADMMRPEAGEPQLVSPPVVAPTPVLPRQNEQSENGPLSIAMAQPTRTTTGVSGESAMAQANEHGVPKGEKRKRKTNVQDADVAKSNGALPTVAAPAPTQAYPEVNAAATSQSMRATQTSRFAGSPVQDNNHSQQPAKRQKHPRETLQDSPLLGQAIQQPSVEDGQAVHSESQASRLTSSVDHYETSFGNTGGGNPQRPQQQPSFAAVNRPLHEQSVNTQQSPDNTHTGYKHDETMKGADQLLGNFKSTGADGNYHGLTGMSQQPSFGSQGTVSAASQDDTYRNSTSRSMLQHHAPTFQARQAQQTPSSSMSSFHDYSDPAFLDIAGLDSASQADLTMNSASYGIDGGNMQRASPNMSPPYGSASGMGHSSFDGGMTESALRERMYRSLRRQ